MAISLEKRKLPDHYETKPVVAVSEAGINRRVSDALKDEAVAAHIHFHKDRALPLRAGVIWWDVPERSYACVVKVNGRHHATILRKNVRALAIALNKTYKINPDPEWRPGYINEEATNGDS